VRSGTTPRKPAALRRVALANRAGTGWSIRVAAAAPDRVTACLQHALCIDRPQEVRAMAKYGKKAATMVESAMRRRKKGTLRSGSGGKVTSRKQAIAIGLSEAREKGGKVPKA
jgi:hypothetical protein